MNHSDSERAKLIVSKTSDPFLYTGKALNRKQNNVL